MRRISRAQVIAVIGHVLAKVVREVVPAVVTLAAGDFRSDHYTVADLKRDTFKIGILTVASNGGNRSNVFVPLNDGKTNLFAPAIACVLSGVALISVLISAADAGELHPDQYAARRGLGQGKLTQFVFPGLDQGGREHAFVRHCRKYPSRGAAKQKG